MPVGAPLCGRSSSPDFHAPVGEIAVVIPVYNTAKYLNECFDSLAGQTYRHFTAFVVEDGSEDESPEICDAWAAKDPRFQVVHQPNGGVSAARNAALDRIEEDGRFDWILFFDSDDRLAPTALQTIAQTAVSLQADMLAFGVERFTRSGAVAVPVKKPHAPMVLDQEGALAFNFNVDFMAQSSPAGERFIGNTLFSAKLVQGLRFDARLRIGEDQDYKIRAFGRLRRFVAISDVLYLYRMRKSSLSHSGVTELNDLRLLCDWMSRLDDFPAISRPIIEARLADVWWDFVRHSDKSGSLDQHWTQACSVYRLMKNKLARKACVVTRTSKRMFIFSLGPVAVKTYFRFRAVKPRALRMLDYFD